MALPSFDELLKAYTEARSGGTQALQGLQGGLQQGVNLASVVKQRQAMDQLRQIEAAKYAQQVPFVQAQTELAQAKAKELQDKSNSTEPVFTINKDGKLVKAGDVPKGSKVMQDPGLKLMSPYLQVREEQMLNQIPNSPTINSAKKVIQQGRRIEGLSSKDIVQNPTNLGMMRNLLVSQTEGGKASIAGISKSANETPQQFVSRIMEKIQNAPQDASTQKFVDQILKESKQETISSLLTMKDELDARAASTGDSVPGLSDRATKVAKDHLKAFIKTVTKGKTVKDEDLETREGLEKLFSSEQETKKMSASDEADAFFR